jgi:hypothetical protein
MSGFVNAKCCRALEEKYQLNLPEYPGCEQIVELAEYV